MSNSATPCIVARQDSLPSTISRRKLLKFISIASVMLSNHLILCSSLLLLPSVFPRISVLSNELALLITWLKYWVSASATDLPMNIQSWFPLGLTGLISLPSKSLLNTTVQKHQFFRTQLSLWSSSDNSTWLLEKL